MPALEREALERLVVRGGVGANKSLRATLEKSAAARGARVSFRRWSCAPTTAR
jgi:tRNA A37 threonylcarbamoyltransferase TsaD